MKFFPECKGKLLRKDNYNVNLAVCTRVLHEESRSEDFISIIEQRSGIGMLQKASPIIASMCEY